MGRRALPKIDPSLDLSRHLRELEELACPFVPARIFAREAPLEVEVGTGKGLFMRRAAADAPEHNFLGIEISHKYARFAAAGLAKRQLPNGCVVHGDAIRMFRDYCPSSSLAAVHVYFPDPWWKKRHHKRRVMNAAFVADIERTLQPDGRFHFWTDVEHYYQLALAVVAEHTNLTGPFDVTEELATHTLDYRTHFERRMRLCRERVFRAEFRKAAAQGYGWAGAPTR